MLTSQDSVQEIVKAAEVRFVDDAMVVVLSDGRSVSLPLHKIEWLNWLATATPEQQANWTIEPGGYAIYWEDLDDGIEVTHLLGLQPLA